MEASLGEPALLVCDVSPTGQRACTRETEPPIPSIRYILHLNYGLSLMLPTCDIPTHLQHRGNGLCGQQVVLVPLHLGLLPLDGALQVRDLHLLLGSLKEREGAL